MSDAVLVIGASGTQGGAAARILLKQGFHVLAGARNVQRLSALEGEGAEAVHVDLNEPSTVKQAGGKARFAYFHMPMSVSGPGSVETERNALTALLDAGVEHIVYNTGFALPPEPVGSPMDERIKLLQDFLQGGKVTVLVPTGYLENFNAPWSAPRIARGELLYPQKEDLKVAWVTNEDLGRCAAAAFNTPKSRGRWLRVAGPQELNFNQAADELGRALGKEVTFHRISGKEYAELLAPHLGEQLAQMIGHGYEQMGETQNPLMTPDTSETESLLGVQFTSLYDWARSRDEWKS
ncbi:SDR family oxidoreductase [Salinispira pacifica]|uniref:NmrA-like domain-containing protein n=1 Tax=Salinispira pacifica TaxID=1307761 RepID=V5WGH7_9SPIO|nr:NmrA family NAD(P)-binding protein [Salinispira pacifica]AHC14937.1 hypothetical protein L21SP2_1544 [Salinispira pacifica]